MTGALSAAASLLALIDPRLRVLFWPALALAGLALVRDRRRVFLPVLALVSAVPALAGFSIGADSPSYFAYTSSLLADHDLDFRNQWAHLGFEDSAPTITGLQPNSTPVGPGLIWVPAVALTHLWLALTGGPTDALRLAAPYYSAAAATTLIIALAGTFMLARSLSPLFGKTEAWIAVLASVGASPILFYAALEPLMSHGLTFGASAMTLALTLDAEKEGRRRAWVGPGACLGLATLCRTQSAALALFVAAGLWRSRAGWRTATVAAAAALAVFSPQLIAWKVLYGSFVTIPQGGGFIDWTGRHTIDVLLSADHGLFNGHPALFLGLLGLVVALPGSRAYALASLVIFSFTAFLNGSVADWNGSDAFGGRRFDLVVPLFALGLAALLSRARPLLSRRPLALPVAALLAAVLWNASLIDLRRHGRANGVLPVDDLARLQIGQFRRALEATLGPPGSSARAVIYKAFVGLSTYETYRPGGDFDLATLEPRFVRKGWSDVQWWDNGSAFRYLLYPEACIVIPLDEPFDLRGFVLARAPARIEGQRLTLILNGHTLAEAALPAAWTEVPFGAPRRVWRAGENEFCVRATKKRRGDEGDDLAFAAAVIRIQLP